MINELLFFLLALCIGISSLWALYLGKEALIAFICIQCILANLFVIKQITLFGLTATPADAYSIGVVLGLNLLQEYFGKEITKKAITINFFFLVLYVIVSQLHLLFVPTVYDTTQEHFMALLGLMPRIVIASLTTYFIVQQIDCALYGLLKNWYQERHLVARNYVSILLCQLIDTVLFSYLGLYGVVENIGQIIIVSYAIKLVAAALATPWIYFSKRLPLHRQGHKADPNSNFS